MRALQDLSYQGLVCAALLLRKPLAGYYITNIVDEQIPFTAVIEMSALMDRKHFEGHTLVYLPKYVPSEDSTFLMSDEQIRELFLAGLRRMFPVFHPDDVLHFRVARDRHVSPILTLNYSQRQSPLREFNERIHIVNATYILEGTHNMSETVRVATDAAARLIGGREGLPG
jgi:protoporphyrinogen oxidase